VEEVCGGFDNKAPVTLENVREADKDARAVALDLIISQDFF
jgi:hypothetical protein